MERSPVLLPPPSPVDDAPPLIEFRKVCKRFGDKVVLDEVDLAIHEGHITSIIGKSGVGKSVLLKHVIGLLKPDRGEVRFRGRSLAAMNREERRGLKREFAYMFQNNALFDSLTIYENVALPLTERTKLAESEIHELVTSKLAELEIGDVGDKYPSQISGGMQKRVALARALITGPRIVLFDEPTTGLDPIRKNAVLSMIAHYQKKFGFTAILVSHDIPDVFYISQRVAILEEQKVLFQGEPVELEMIENDVVRQFVGSLEALKDELTGLETRQNIERRFAREMERFTEAEAIFTILVFSVDNPEDVREGLGHLATQRLVQRLSEFLARTLHPTDISARYSEYRILTLLPRTTLDQAERVRERLAKTIGGQDILHLDSRSACFSFSLRAGLAQCRPGAGLADLVAEADADMKPIAHFECHPKRFLELP
ncbi:MAG: ATP-binding cassette domain-containing protein [Thermodesulfobacteriota bacterium]